MVTNQLYDFLHSGDLDKTRVHLDQKPEELNKPVFEGYTPLHVACLFGHQSLAGFLLGRSALVNSNADNKVGATPLHCVVAFRDELAAERLVHLLLDHGAELNAITRDGQTALHHAVARGSVILSRSLVLAGADPFLKDKFGRAPVDLAKELASENQGDEIRGVLKMAWSLTSV